MGDTPRFLDVWLVEPNTVYREVPYPVVCDWIVQGRLLEGDKLRWAGTAEWFTVNGASGFDAFLPRPDTTRPEDAAEALEPVDLGLRWRSRPDAEEDDVDMIPLIDVSLVLLIFFMMTSVVAAAGDLIPTPTADHGSLSERAKMIWVGINLEGKTEPRQVVFSVGLDDKAPARKEDGHIATQDDLLSRFDELLAAQPGRIDVSTNAHPDLRSGIIRELTVELNQPGRREKIGKKFTGVRDRNQ